MVEQRDWWVVYNWSNNPFYSKPSKTLIGLNSSIDKIISKVKGDRIVMVEGPTGAGKTCLLSHLEQDSDFKSKGVINTSAIRLTDKDDNEIEKYLINLTRKGFWVFKKPKRDMVLFVDEFNLLTTHKADLIRELVEKPEEGSTHFSGLVIAANNSENLSVPFLSRIKGGRIKLLGLSDEEAKELIESRIKEFGESPFSDVALKRLIQLSKRGSKIKPRTVLLYAEEVCSRLQKRSIDVADVNRAVEEYLKEEGPPADLGVREELELGTTQEEEVRPDAPAEPEGEPSTAEEPSPEKVEPVAVRTEPVKEKEPVHRARGYSKEQEQIAEILRKHKKAMTTTEVLKEISKKNSNASWESINNQMRKMSREDYCKRKGVKPLKVIDTKPKQYKIME